jgi:truncated hemoglobin YjbI
MRVAVEESGMSPEQIETFWAYVVRAAHFLVNTPDDEPVARSFDVH